MESLEESWRSKGVGARPVNGRRVGEEVDEREVTTVSGRGVSRRGEREEGKEEEERRDRRWECMWEREC